MNILVVEDEQKVAAFLKSGLEEKGYAVDIAYDGFVGEKLFMNKSYEIVLLDVILPLMNGIELCRRMKFLKPETPVLMLTALGTTDDKLTGFDSGADDYLIKPFEFKELVARIKALAKRTSLNAPNKVRNIIKVSDLELDLEGKVAQRQGRVISLTSREFHLLEYLMRNSGKVVSRVDISENVWDVSFDTGTNVVDVYVNILRKKIDKDFTIKLIHTRIGLGYVLQEP